MAQKSSIPGTEFYQSNPLLKWIVLGISILISIGSIYYTNVLVEQLKERERQQVQLFARAIEYTLNDDLSSNFLFVSEEIISKNNSVPTIWITRDGQYQHRNINIDPKWSEARKKRVLDQQLAQMKEAYEPIDVIYNHDGIIENYGYVYYKNSSLLRHLITYPYIQLSVIAIFGFIIYLAFKYSNAA
jgi:hypothetical protein